MKKSCISTLTSFAAVAALYLGAPCSTSAAVITGSFTDYPELSVSPLLSFGDGFSQVTVGWGVANSNSSGYFLGADYPFWAPDTEVAFASGITSIEQITDASAFSFTSGSTLAISEGSFVVLRSTLDGRYGALRIDDIFPYLPEPEHAPYAGMDGRWWFQTDGSSTFAPASVPDRLSTGITFSLLMAVMLLLPGRMKGSLSSSID